MHLQALADGIYAGLCIFWFGLFTTAVYLTGRAIRAGVFAR